MLASSVEDAAEIVIEAPLLKVVPLIVPNDPVRRLVPIVLDAISLPFWSVARSDDVVRPVNQVLPVKVASVEDAFANDCKPVHAFALPRFKLNVCTPEPLYALPERPDPRERLARVPPSATPLMVEFWS